jgi:hypothetical protein
VADLWYYTYLGGDGDDFGWAIAVDGQGAAHVVGETSFGTFPTTPGAFQSCAGWDAFVVKLDSSGGLAYGTCIGGVSIDTARGVAVDPAGVVYVTGYTLFTGAMGRFPTTVGAYQRFNAGLYDAFVAKLNPQGAGTADLLYSTLYGANGFDLAQDIELHGSTIYIAGYSSGTGTLPTTLGAYQRLKGGAEDGFLAVFNPAGSGQADLRYATYLGGNRSDFCFGLAVDASGVAYLGGYIEGTSPNTFPTTAGAFDTSFGGFMDGFVSKINPAGGGLSDLLYSSYVGGSSNDFTLDLAIDDAGTVYLTGSAGPGYPTTPDAYQAASAGGVDASLTRLNPAGGGASDLLYSTYFGGSDNDFAYAVAVGGDGVANVAGSTLGEIPTTVGAFQTANAGSFDVFLARLAIGPTSPSHDLFLHGHGSMEHSPILFLDGVLPDATDTRQRDSGAVKLAGGNPWKAIGTWSADPEATTGALLIGRLDSWLGLKKSDDEGTNFDLRAELLKNDVAIDAAEVYCIRGIVEDPAIAKRISLAFAPPAAAGFDGTTDTLSLRLWTRIGTDGAGESCGGNTSAVGLRFFFDSMTRPAALSIREP